MTRQDQISLFLWCAGAATVLIIVLFLIGRDFWRLTAEMNRRDDEWEDEL